MNPYAKLPLPQLLVRARELLHLTQRDLSKKVSSSERSVRRYETGKSNPALHHYAYLSTLVRDDDAPLAEELLRRGRATAARYHLPFEEPVVLAPPKLDVTVKETAQALALAPSAAIATKPIDSRHMVDAVVCAAIDQSEILPRVLRPLLLAAFTRAEELGLDVAEVRRGLEPRRPTPRGKRVRDESED